MFHVNIFRVTALDDFNLLEMRIFRSSLPEVFSGKDALKIYNKFTGEHPCRSVISINLQCNFFEITLRHECSLVHFLHIFGMNFSYEHLCRAALLNTGVIEKLIMAKNGYKGLRSKRLNSWATPGTLNFNLSTKSRNSPPEVFLGKGVLNICSKFTGEHSCRSVI